MQKEHKVAIARIFADLIKADRIIDTAEMECWSKFCDKYAIDSEARIDARQMTFADALSTICTSDVKG